MVLLFTRCIVGLFLFFTCFLSGWEKSRLEGSVELVTIPKSGTHLLTKYFQLLRDLHLVENLQFEHHHFHHEVVDLPHGFYLNRPHGRKRVIMLRDLRDVMCSFVPYLEKDRLFYYEVNFSSEWEGMTQREKIFEIMDYHREGSSKILWSQEGINFAQRFRETIRRGCEYVKAPKVCIIRFEKFVGPRGGAATILEQKAEIQKLNDYLGIKLSRSQYAYFLTHLFGGTRTFRTGKVGSYKRIFDAELFKVFEENYGEANRQLGYQ